MFAAGLVKRSVGKLLISKWALVPAGALALALPTAARADAKAQWGRDGRDSRVERRYDDRRDDDHRDYDHDRRSGGINVDIRVGERRPEYRVRETRVWVPATYRTVIDRRWVEPVYRVETERVWVPAVFEDREVHYYERGRLCTRIERVLVHDGYFESRDRRVCVSEGRWDNCERQELVSDGHYEIRTERVRVPYRVDPLVVVNPGLGGIWHR